MGGCRHNWSTRWLLCSTASRASEPGVVADLLADEAALVEVASSATPDGFRAVLRRRIDQIRGDLGQAVLERQRKASKASTWIDRDDGMYLLRVALDPDRGQALFAAIAQRIGELRNQPSPTVRSEGELRLQAVLELIAGTASVVAEVLVVVDERTVREGPHDHSMCETEAGVPLPIGLGIELCATAKITTAVIGVDGRAAGMTCAARTASGPQRRALRTLYRSCAFPGCATPFTECVMHHVIHWEHGGPTAVENLLPLCIDHHQLVHDGGWNVTIGPRRTLRWYRPDGTLDRTTPLRPLADQLGFHPVHQRPVGRSDAEQPDQERGPPRLFGPDAA